MFVADSLWLLLPAMYLNGASYAFRSGAQQAFLFDSLAHEPTGGRFTTLFGKLNAVSYIAIAATTALGAGLADRDYALPFGLAVGCALAAAWLAAGLREPERPDEGRRGMGGTIAEALRIVRGNRQLLVLVIFAAAMWTVSALVHLYAQAVLVERGLAPSQVGLVFAAALFTTALGAWLAGRLVRMRPFRFWTVAATGAIAGSGVLLGGGTLWMAIAGSDPGRALRRLLRADGRAAGERRDHVAAAGDGPFRRGLPLLGDDDLGLSALRLERRALGLAGGLRGGGCRSPRPPGPLSGRCQPTTSAPTFRHSDALIQ